LRASSFDRRKEPPNIKAVEGQSMKWGAREALRGLKEPPDVIYDLGDVGKEPMIRILGENAVDVVRKAVKIAGKVKELKNTS
ncbi:MAG: bifunctional hydroxymethylpyrimidine kinase/phosphomethylpyrimidine kinase, partial [Thermoprotei archaeon]